MQDTTKQVVNESLWTSTMPSEKESTMFDPASGRKWLTVDQLMELLTNVHPDFRVEANKVGNLAILDESGQDLIAWVDFAKNELCNEFGPIAELDKQEES